MLKMSSYKNMDEVLKLINNKYISLDTEEVKRSNERLRSTLWDLIRILREDKLFAKLFERPYFGGSYYDDLKVGKPDEFDLDLLLVLPKACETHKIKNCGCVKVTPSNKPGSVWFQVQKGFCGELDQYIKDGYMQTDLILNWLKGIVTKALSKLSSLNSDIYDYSVRYFSESGPALTLQLNGSFGYIDVDLVPAFKFGPELWPREGFRSNLTSKPEFFIVPKRPKGMIYYGERYWRLSFQDQERELIKGKERLKPALRLLKKMRNNLVHKSISSYALKTIVLWDLDTSYFNWNDPIGDTFMKLLEKYKECLDNGRIPYYWKKNNNLLDGIDPITLSNHHNEISRLLKRIKDTYKTNPCIVATVVLKEGTTEYKDFVAAYQRQNSVSNTTGLLERMSSQGSSYYTFDPSSTSGSGTDYTGYNSRTNQQTQDSSSGWATAGGVILGVGAAVALGLGIFGALNRNNRNQN